MVLEQPERPVPARQERVSDRGAASGASEARASLLADVSDSRSTKVHREQNGMAALVVI